ncbi:MAG: dihydrolipoyl dehydrogenase [Pseudomonadota bacterium]|jgi:dihydrolipoamide dehydrogenase|nr:dihydrolipoyl dehydrogenase [Pseudomonadota bacterium]GIR08869.1 MAG: dihydrolipoyl dehydrogenase [Gammaproteobacteria bacterium]|tara:strand:- start:9613 stop:11031 length:1419 start_codon:yes stop_codon:yes gene_type:complete
MEYDVVVIGGGPGGYVAAIKASQLGLKTACVEFDEDESGKQKLGGTCLNVGCIPSKSLLDSSYKFQQISESFEEHGISVTKPKYDLSTMMDRKNGIVKKLTSGVSQLLKHNKVDAFHGKGKLISSTEVEITDTKGKKTSVTAKNIVLATGSRPINIPSVPWNGTTIVGSAGALEFSETPKKLAIIGAGVIGLELGSVWSRLGSEVEIFEAEKTLLPMLDADMSKAIEREFRSQNLDIKLGCMVQGSKKSRKGVSLEVEIDGKLETKEYDKVIVAVGRRPFTENLLAEGCGLETDEKGFIDVDEFCKTKLDNVYAIGDIVRGPMLAHKAMEEGVMAAERIANKKMEVNYDLVPSVIYTHPEIAWVGKTEKQLKEEGVEYKKGSFPFAASGRALASGDSVGSVKVVADKDTDQVLGVQVFGNGASEILQQGLIGMEFSASSEDFGLTMFSHPTVSEALHEAALAVNKQAIHIGN